MKTATIKVVVFVFYYERKILNFQLRVMSPRANKSKGAVGVNDSPVDCFSIDNIEKIALNKALKGMRISMNDKLDDIFE